MQNFLKSIAFQKCTWHKKSDIAPHFRRRRCGEAAFLVLAAKTIPSAVLFSFSQGSALIISALMANFLFGEKANAKSIIGMIMAFGALLIINL